MQSIVLLLLGALAACLGLEVYLRRRAAQPNETWDTRTLPDPDRQATRIVVLGDSIAYGQYLEEAQAWPALLAERLIEEYPQQHWQVVNAGVPGDTTADAYLRFQSHVAAYRPRLVLIALGLNDCHRTGSTRADPRLERFRQNERAPWGRSYLYRAAAARFGSPPQGKQSGQASVQDRPIVPLDDYKNIMAWLARRSQRLGSYPIFLTLSPLHPAVQDSAEWGLWADYNQAIRDLGRALNGAGYSATGAGYSATPVIEVSHRFAPGEYWIEDGVHLSAGGQAALAARVWQGLQRPNVAPALALDGQITNAEMAPSLD